VSHILAIINQKGGVGKTTTAINLGVYLSKMGKSVLLVDMDPQGNATSGLGLDKTTLDSTMYDVLFNGVGAQTIAKDSPNENVKILPANANLAAAEIDLVSLPNREHKLKEALANLEYDYILIDCPPALGLLTINALTAAQKVIIPVQAEYYALEGLGQLLDVIQRVRTNLNPNLEILGVVVTMYDSRISLAEQVVEELKKHFESKVFGTVVPRNVRLAEAPSYGRSIAAHDRWSKGARAYKQLAKEVTKRLS
jgi:chromosome partitioning protein